MSFPQYFKALAEYEPESNRALGSLSERTRSNMVPTLCAAIEAIPNVERLVLALRLVEELTFDEIAVILHRDPESVIDLYKRGLHLISVGMSQRWPNLANSGQSSTFAALV